MNKAALKRLDKLEKALKHKRFIPVVFIKPHADEVYRDSGCLVVRSEEEMDKYSQWIGEDTVIFLNDIERVKEAIN